MKNRPLLSVCLMVLCIIAFMVVWGRERFIKELRPSPIERYAAEGDNITISGKIYRQEQKENCRMIYLKENSIYSNSKKFQESKIIIYTNSSQKLHIGNQIKVCGKVSFYEEARNPGNFDQKFYYQKQGIHGKVRSDDIQITDYKRNKLKDRLEKFRMNWQKMLQREMGERDGSALAAILLGEKSGMDQEMKELYQVNGIGHILAISGLHLSFAGLGVYRIARRMTGSYKAGGITGGILLCLYVMMIGMTVSVIRAWVMFVFRIGADITGRHYDMPTALAASAVLTVGIHPLYLYDGGFWLSFGAVFAVCTVIPVLENEMRCKSLCAGLGINVLLWPVILYNFFEIPVYSILLNLIILPLMSVVLTCGMIGSFIKMAGWIPGKWILWICRCILWVYDKCCVFTIKLPMARWVAGRPDKRRIFIYYLVLMTVILILKFKRNGKKYIISITLYTVGFLILISGPWIRTGAEVTMLDVGQGDCICVEGPEHKTYLIDGGSSDIKNVGKYRIEPFLKYRGIGSIDYVFVSHGDIDHMNGIEEMLKRQQVGIKIRNLVVTGEAYRDEKLEELISVAEDNGTTVWEMENGTQIREGKLRFTCLGPKEKNMNPGNEASMILHLEYEGFDMLFTGDVEKEGEESLTDTLSYLQEKKISWEVLKTAHHGSKNSTTEAFLENVKPRYAWISAGRKNRYGHPHKDTLERLENSGAKIYSTQENGAFGITVNKKSMRIHGRNG